MTKRVLLVAYYYPPQPKAGALRPAYIARHIREFGWEPTVLTVAYPGASGLDGDVIGARQIGKTPTPEYAAPENRPARSPIERSVREFIRNIIYFPDDAIGWYPDALVRGRRAAGERKFDAVLSTAPPPTAHFVGRAIGMSARIPWIADYRDLWSGPPGPYFAREFGNARRALSYALERWLLRRAARLTAPTRGHADALAEYFHRDDVVTIPNACDMSAWDGIDAPPPSEFRLCYTGKLYPRLRTPDVLFGAAAKLRLLGDAAGNAARFDFYGEDPGMVAEAAARFGISDAVAIHGEVDRRDALRAQRAAAALVLLLNTAGEVDHIEVGNPGSKIFEYAGARRPILAIGSPGNAVEDVMRESGLGLFASDEAESMSAIRRLYADFQAGKLEPVANPAWQPTTPRELAHGFAEVLNAAIS